MSTSAHWASLLGELTALAAVVALSPFTVVPAILLIVHSDRPRAVGLSFITGWLLSKAAITVALLELLNLFWWRMIQQHSHGRGGYGKCSASRCSSPPWSST
ncbi:GAP family protein [Mycolicibacterium sp. S2-37]|nr:GAP family protein [Mycolicibacterium sp. S2-37]